MPRWILGCFAAAVMLSGVATAGPVANQVCLYEHSNYGGLSYCLALEPGMRHKLVPTLGSFNDLASSIQVGEGVEVYVFEHAHFGGVRYLHDISAHDLVVPERPERQKFWPNLNDLVSSMIIIPRGKPLSGVELRGAELELWGGKMSPTVFYPLPERLNDLYARYPNLKDSHMNDGAHWVVLHGDVEVILYEHSNYGGRSLKLPEDCDQGETFNLRKCIFNGIASSLVVSQGTQ